MAIKNIATGSVSLRFRHPKEDLTFLSLLLELPCYRNWISGTRRQTPKGSLLPGVYKDSYWVSRLEFLAQDGFKKEFVLAVNHLIKAEQEILKLVETGGKIEIYLQLPGNANNGGIIDNTYSSLLGKLGVDLLIEVFPNGELGK